jgi:hypothetical protein
VIGHVAAALRDYVDHAAQASKNTH